MGRITSQRNAIATTFLTEGQTTVPTQAELTALGHGAMSVRRAFGSFNRAMKMVLRHTALVSNVGPIVANPLVDQTVANTAALSYIFAANSFTDAEGQTLTYSATLSSGAALPGWLTFTPGTRTFAGTAPAETGVITVEVSARDIYGRLATDTFTVTVT